MPEGAEPQEQPSPDETAPAITQATIGGIGVRTSPREYGIVSIDTPPEARCELCGDEINPSGRAFTNKKGSWVHFDCGVEWNKRQGGVK